MAGSWGAITYIGKETNGDMFAMSCNFTADAANGSIPDLTIPSTLRPSFLTDVGVKRDGTTPPNTLTFAVKDADGLTVYTETGITASTRYPVSDRPSMVGGGTVSFSGNTTNSAKAKVILYFANNARK